MVTASFTEVHPASRVQALGGLELKAPCSPPGFPLSPVRAQFHPGSSSPLSFLLGQHACCGVKQSVWDTGKALPKPPSLMQSGQSPWQSPPTREELKPQAFSTQPPHHFHARQPGLMAVATKPEAPETQVARLFPRAPLSPFH